MHSSFSFLNLENFICFDIPSFVRKRIEANYLKYLKASLERVGYFISILNSIMSAFVWMDNLNLIQMVIHLKTLVSYTVQISLEIAAFSGQMHR